MSDVSESAKNLAILRKSYVEKVEAAKKLSKPFVGEGKPIPEKDATKITALLGEADTVKVQISLLQQLFDAEEYAQAPAGTKAAHLGWREAGPKEGDRDIDPKAWRTLEYNDMYGRKMSMRYHVPLCVQKKGYDPAFEAYLRKGYSRLGPRDAKTLSEGVDAAGGFTVTEDYHREILRKTATQAAVRPLARVVTTSSDAIQWPRLVYNADDKYTSGVRFTWSGEIPSSATEHRVTDPVIGLLTIPIHTAMASLPITNTLIEDSAFDILGLGSDLFAEAFSLGEDDVFINGDGVSKPMGMITRITVGDAGHKIASVISGHATELEPDGLIDLFFGLPSQYRRTAQWMINSATAKAARKLKDTTERYLWDAMNGGLVSPGDQDSLLGKGVTFDEFMPDVGAGTYPVLFGDFSGYFIGDRVGLAIQRLSELYAETNITVLLARKRVGGDVCQPYRLRAQEVSAT